MMPEFVYGEDRRVHVHLVVDLVEGQPVGHQVLVALHHRGGEAHEAVDDLAVGEAAHLGQVQGHFEVGEGDDRLHALGAVVGEQLFVELESGLVRSSSSPFGKCGTRRWMCGST